MSVKQFSRSDLDAACDAGDYVVVDFYADWCGPCKTMAPHFEAAARGDTAKKVTFAKIDTEAEQQLAAEAKTVTATVTGSSRMPFEPKGKK